MENRKLNFRVGVFVLVSAALFTLLAVIAIGSRFGNTKARYTVHFHETIKGMVRGSPVNFQGVNIGIVTDMRFVGGRTEVIIEVDPERAPIQRATRASLDRAWVTGQVTVELFGWEEDGELLHSGGVIQAELSASAVVMRSLPEVMNRVTDILEEFEGIGKSINRLLDSDSDLMTNAQATVAELRTLGQRLNGVLSKSNVDRMGRILRELERLGANANDRIVPSAVATLDQMRKVGTRLVGAVARIESVAAGIEKAAGGPALEKLLAEGQGLLSDVRGHLPQLARAGAELEVFLRGNRRDFGRALASFASALHEVKGLARILNAAPSALVWGKSRPQPAVRDVPVKAMPPVAPGGGKE